MGVFMYVSVYVVYVYIYFKEGSYVCRYVCECMYVLKVVHLRTATWIPTPSAPLRSTDREPDNPRLDFNCYCYCYYTYSRLG